MEHLRLSHESIGHVTERAVTALADGGVIVYPTDTVYGLGADATNPDAVERVRRVKGREDGSKPILVMVADVAMLEAYAALTPLAQRLVEHVLPGPVSLILEPRTRALAHLASEDGGVGFRIPDNEFCQNLVREFGRPITSTSANRTGLLQERALEGILTQLGLNRQSIACVIDAGTLPVSKPSTVIDVRFAQPVVVREGAISRQSLAIHCPPIRF